MQIVIHFTVLAAGECRDLDVVVTMTDGWDDTEFETDKKMETKKSEKSNATSIS